MTKVAIPLGHKHDIKQFRQACKALRLTPEERYEASEALHADKSESGDRSHMTYEELVTWLQQWRES